MDTTHKGIVITITEQSDMDSKPYALAAASIALEGVVTGIALAIAGWRAVRNAGMRKTDCREYIVDGCHNLIIAGDDTTDHERTRK